MTTTDRPDRRLDLSLGTRIVLVTSLLIALSVGAAVAVTSLVVRDIARKAAHDAVQGSASTQDTLQAQYYEQLKLMSRLFVGDPALTAYIAQAAEDKDSASILDQLSSRQQDLKFSFAIVLDPTGRVIARTDNPTSRQDLSQQALIREAVAGPKETAGVWREGDRLYYAVAVPMTKNFELLGFMVTAFEITNATASRVSAGAATDVAFVAMDSGGVRVVASTLGASMRQPLERALNALTDQALFAARGHAAAAAEPREIAVSLLDEPWLALATPLLDAAGRQVGASVALASVRKEEAAFGKIQQVMLLAGLAAVLIAPLLALVVTRRTLGPVHRLVAAAEAARQGDYNQQIDAGGADEVGKLARAFDVLLRDLREKRDMEAYVTQLSRNLPEPGEAAARVVLGGAQMRESVVMALELFGFGRSRGESGPERALQRLEQAMTWISSTVESAGGEIEAVAGHRVLARFTRGRQPLGALAAAAQILQPHAVWGDAENSEPPSIALASGSVVTGPLSWGDQNERALIGQPVQQLESLLREATPGDLVLARDVYMQLRDGFVRAGYELAPRRGLISPQPIYALTADLAARLVSSPLLRSGSGELSMQGTGAGEEASAVVTLSGVAPGSLMGHRFQVLSVLGSGGMGVVYKARDRELDDLVALKVLRQDQWNDPAQLERLKSELKLARKITHPNVLRTYDFGEIDRVAFISMEYVRGVTLRFMIDQSHRLPYSAALRLGKQLCAGLAAAHAVGVIHRDIKPENLILEPTGNVKLMDFGIARPVQRLQPGQTQAGFIVGTPQYLAPEQVQGGEIDTRADIYSCGVVLYEIFSGSVPFKAATAMEVVIKHLQVEPPPPREFWPEMPARLEAAILRCLRKSPDERFQRVEELQQELEALSA